jgi:hypothetical protein
LVGKASKTYLTMQMILAASNILQFKNHPIWISQFWLVAMATLFVSSVQSKGT